MNNTLDIWAQNARPKIDRSPWGKVQTCESVTPWMQVISTASHGGIKLDASHNRLIPATRRRKSGWYEEDCEVAIPLYFLFDLIEADRLSSASWFKVNREEAKRQMDYWFPQQIQS